MTQPIRLGLIAVASPLEVGAGDAAALLARLEARPARRKRPAA